MTPFGTTSDGHAVDRLTLAAGGLEIGLLTWGAILQSARLDGVPYDLTLGSDRLADYEDGMRYFGAIVGPVVNRLSGATAPIGGELHRFEANQAGRITLHSGSAGTYRKVWKLRDHGPSHATLALTLPDGEGNFPGTRQVEARFELEAPATLRLTITATTDRLTLINFANHSYWNLDGTETWDGHRLRVAADRVLPTTPDYAPTGEIARVEDVGLDFREEREIAPGEPLLDHNFCLSDARGPMREVLRLTGRSGVALEIATTEPGIQVYDGRDAIRPGRGRHEGLAIETQFWPDAPNHDGFPSIELAPGETYRSLTEWRFSAP